MSQLEQAAHNLLVALNINPSESKVSETVEQLKDILAQQDKCKVCDGHGMVGGFVNMESGYQSDACESCGGTGKEVAPQEKPEPVAVPPYLLNGTRFKVCSDGGYGALILGLPFELIGSWVAFVAADDDCHLKPPRREWVGLTDEQIRSIKESFCDEPIFPISLARAIESKLKELNT